MNTDDEQMKKLEEAKRVIYCRNPNRRLPRLESIPNKVLKKQKFRRVRDILPVHSGPTRADLAPTRHPLTQQSVVSDTVPMTVLGRIIRIIRIVGTE